MNIVQVYHIPIGYILLDILYYNILFTYTFIIMTYTLHKWDYEPLVRVQRVAIYSQGISAIELKYDIIICRNKRIVDDDNVMISKQL